MKIVRKNKSTKYFVLYENGLMFSLSKADAKRLEPDIDKWATDIGNGAWSKLATVNSWVREALGQDPDSGGVKEG